MLCRSKQGYPACTPKFTSYFVEFKTGFVIGRNVGWYIVFGIDYQASFLHMPPAMARNAFDYSLDFDTTDFRKHPELYRIGVGEQGVLLVQPYKSEILPHWKFKNEEIARESATRIFRLFEEYLENHDFVGADMARKYLQMGFTRARRYANHRSGRKYSIGQEDQTEGKEYPYSSGSKNKGNELLEQESDALTNEKARAASVFKEFWFRAKDHPEYLRQKGDFREKYYA